MIILTAISTEVWMGMLSAVLGGLGGIGGSAVTFWVGRRKRKMKQKQDQAKSERLGITSFNIRELKERPYVCVPPPDTERLLSSTVKGDSTDEDLVESSERVNFMTTVRRMIKTPESGIIVITGPSDTGKETLLCRAVLSCCPDDTEDASEDRCRLLRKALHVMAHRRHHQNGGLAFYYVKDMTKEWSRIKGDVVKWFGLRADELIKRGLCIVYFDFNSLSKERAANSVENVKELYEEIGQLGKSITIIFAVKITGVGLDIASGNSVLCFNLQELFPDQMIEIQKKVLRDRKEDVGLLDGRRLREMTGGKIGRLMSIFRQDQAKDRRFLLSEHACREWFRREDATCMDDSRVERGMATVYLLAAMARRMDPQSEVNVRELVHHIVDTEGKDALFGDYRTILRNAFLFVGTDFSAVRRDDFHMDNQSFWNMFLSSWGVFGRYDFTDELHHVIRLMQGDDTLRDYLLQVALSVSDAVIETSYSTSAETTVLSIVLDRFATLMGRIARLQGFRQTFHMAFSRSLASWLWRRIGVLDNDKIIEAIAAVVAVNGCVTLDARVLVEFMPVLVVTSRNPVKWFGGEKWWNRIEAPRLAAAVENHSRHSKDDAETFLLLASYTWMPLSNLGSIAGNGDELRELAGYVKSIRHIAYPLVGDAARKVISITWRVLAESRFFEKGCHHDHEFAERRYLSSVVKLLKERDAWWNTRLSCLVPTLVRGLKLDHFSSLAQGVFRRSTAELNLVPDSLSVIYERCYMQTLTGLLAAYRNFYGPTTNLTLKGLRAQLRDRNRVGVHVSKAVLDATQTDEPEKLRCITWIQSNDIESMFDMREVSDGDRNEAVHILVSDALTWQKDLTDQYRAYCFKYLSRLCNFMSVKLVDAKLPDAYLFIEELSNWLGSVDVQVGASILDELASDDKGMSQRGEYVLESLPEILVNVYRAFEDRATWEEWERFFKRRNFGVKFFGLDLIEYVLLESLVFVKNATIVGRRNLIECLSWIANKVPNRKYATRIAEVSLGRLQEMQPSEVIDEDYYACVLSALNGLSTVEINHEVVYRAISMLANNAKDDAVARAIFEWVRRLESIGAIRNDYQTEWLYLTLGRCSTLKGADSYDDWCVSLLKRVPNDVWLRDQYIEIAFDLRTRPDVSELVAKNAILGIFRHGESAHDEKWSFYDYEWRVYALYNTEHIWRQCMSEEEQGEIRRFIFMAWNGDYRPANETIYNFMQDIMQIHEILLEDVAPWVDVVRKVSEKVSPAISFFPHVLLEGDRVDVAISTDVHALLMNVLPDKDYEVDGSIHDECHGSVPLVRDGVISIGFVTMLHRIQNTLQRLEPECHVDVGIVANSKTLLNIERYIRALGGCAFELHLLDYCKLQNQITDVFTDYALKNCMCDDGMTGVEASEHADDMTGFGEMKPVGNP